MPQEISFAECVAGPGAGPCALGNANAALRRKHESNPSGVCFEIIRQRNEETIFQRCIDSQARGDALRGRVDVAFQGDAGETLTFKTVCEESCDYAWSYWEKVIVE